MEKEFGGSGEAPKLVSIPEAVATRLMAWERPVGGTEAFGGIDRFELPGQEEGELAPPADGISGKQDLVMTPDPAGGAAATPRGGVSYEAVAAACDALVAARGVAAVSNRAVRVSLGRGSFTTINPHVRTWTARRRETETLIDDLNPQAVETLWLAVRAALATALARDKAARDKAARELEAEVADLEAEVADRMSQLKDEEDEVVRCILKTNALSVDLSKMGERISSLSAQVTGLEAETARLAAARDAAATAAAVASAELAPAVSASAASRDEAEAARVAYRYAEALLATEREISAAAAAGARESAGRADRVESTLAATSAGLAREVETHGFTRSDLEECRGDLHDALEEVRTTRMEARTLEAALAAASLEKASLGAELREARGFAEAAALLLSAAGEAHGLLVSELRASLGATRSSLEAATRRESAATARESATAHQEAVDISA